VFSRSDTQLATVGMRTRTLGAGSLGKGKPISLLFETLKHRDQDPERDLS